MIEHGGVVERGTHAELIAAGGRYAAMHRQGSAGESLEQVASRARWWMRCHQMEKSSGVALRGLRPSIEAHVSRITG